MPTRPDRRTKKGKDGLTAVLHVAQVGAMAYSAGAWPQSWEDGKVDLSEIVSRRAAAEDLKVLAVEPVRRADLEGIVADIGTEGRVMRRSEFYVYRDSVLSLSVIREDGALNPQDPSVQRFFASIQLLPSK